MLLEINKPINRRGKKKTTLVFLKTTVRTKI